MKRLILIGKKYYRELSPALTKQEFEVLPIPDNPYVDPRLSGHADLSVFYPGGEAVFLAPFLKGSEAASALKKLGYEIVFPEIDQASRYPYDVQMNLCAAEDSVFYNRKTASPTIVDYLTNNGFRLYCVNQGYTRCSTCVLADRGIITSDRGVHAAAVSCGFDCLLISPGFVGLEGFDYGFIGGAAFMTDSSTLAFTGNIDAHPDRSDIIEHLKKHRVEALFLTERPIFDIGSAIVLAK